MALFYTKCSLDSRVIRNVFAHSIRETAVPEIIEGPPIRAHAFVWLEDIEVSTERSETLSRKSSSAITLRGARG